MSSGYVEHVRQWFMTASREEVEQKMKDLPRDLMGTESDLKVRASIRAHEEEQERNALKTKKDTYYRTDDVFTRAVCSSENPQYEVKGMPAWNGNVKNYDEELKGYYGVHVGGGWLPIMKRDSYCDDDAYIYEIDTSLVFNSTKPFYIMDDYHIVDATHTPGSNIIFSKFEIIPAKLIKLKKVIPYDEIPYAPEI